MKHIKTQKKKVTVATGCIFCWKKKQVLINLTKPAPYFSEVLAYWYYYWRCYWPHRNEHLNDLNLKKQNNCHFRMALCKRINLKFANEIVFFEILSIFLLGMSGNLRNNSYGVDRHPWQQQKCLPSGTTGCWLLLRQSSLSDREAAAIFLPIILVIVVFLQGKSLRPTSFQVLF